MLCKEINSRQLFPIAVPVETGALAEELGVGAGVGTGVDGVIEAVGDASGVAERVAETDTDGVTVCCGSAQPLTAEIIAITKAPTR